MRTHNLNDKIYFPRECKRGKRLMGFLHVSGDVSTGDDTSTG
jgi:hypothetical protein